LIQNSDAMDMSPDVMSQLSPLSAANGGGDESNGRNEWHDGHGRMAGMPGMGGMMMPPAVLPKINLLLGPDRKLMASAMAQMAQSTTKGMPGTVRRPGPRCKVSQPRG
jgi:hypothetical protein